MTRVSLKAPYKFCSICAAALREERGGNLHCTKCSFVNYHNPRPTVTALVLHKGRLLLTRRARAPYKLWWDLPGGFMETGESPEEAVKRELKEETGLDIKIKKLFGFYTGTYPSKTEPFYILSVVYLCSSPTDKLLALDDVCESRWFKKADIPKRIAFDSNQKVMRDFLKKWG